jgi:23S rRNA G2445 N2-methylase RlmL
MMIFVSCLPRVEPILVDEMKRLGFDCRMEGGGVTPTANVTLKDILRLTLHLGMASHVLIRCGESFYCPRATGTEEKSWTVSLA